VYYHFRKWSRDGSFAVAKKDGASLTYQPRQRAKTSNILPSTEARGYILAPTGIVAGHHNDAFNLKPHLQAAFQSMPWSTNNASAANARLSGLTNSAPCSFIRHDRKDVYFLAAHHFVFALINLHHLMAPLP
jgi:hypothetical protein